MTEIQIISKILEERSIDQLLEANINAEYFITYQNEIKFIFNHYNEHGNIPTKETFLERFSGFELGSTLENWEFLIAQIREGYMFANLSTTLNQLVPIIEEDSIKGYNILKQKMEELENIKRVTSNDIVKNAKTRLEEYKIKVENPDANVIKIGLEEMDEKIIGWNMGEELITIMARTNQGKSWILVEFLLNAWKQGKRVGLYSGEMSAEQIGYRFDALNEHFSNLDLIKAEPGLKKEYEKYINTLQKNDNCFVVITPKDLGHQATVQDIEYLIKKHNLDIVGVDQFSLMQDSRSKSGEQLRIRLGNISADLFNLSMKYKIPVIALSQANRAASKSDVPELEHMSESDTIAQNSTKVISIARVEGALKLSVVKNRYGKVGDSFIYDWDIDKGKFTFRSYGEDKKSSSNGSPVKIERRTQDEGVPF